MRTGASFWAASILAILCPFQQVGFLRDIEMLELRPEVKPFPSGGPNGSHLWRLLPSLAQ
jgi:hypothetical protein